MRGRDVMCVGQSERTIYKSLRIHVEQNEMAWIEKGGNKDGDNTEKTKLEREKVESETNNLF